jgi:hypothetical protein
MILGWVASQEEEVLLRLRPRGTASFPFLCVQWPARFEFSSSLSLQWRASSSPSNLPFAAMVYDDGIECSSVGLVTIEMPDLWHCEGEEKDQRNNTQKHAVIPVSFSSGLRARTHTHTHSLSLDFFW